MIAATDPSVRLIFLISVIATVSAIRNTIPSTPAATTDPTIAARDSAIGILGLLGEVRRGVEADERGETHDRREHQPASGPEIVRRPCGDTTRGEVLNRAVAGDRDHEDQRDRQHPDDRHLDDHRARVEERDDAHRGHDQHGLNEQHRNRDQARGALVSVHAEQRHEQLRLVAARCGAVPAGHGSVPA
jgi:hypothetical protein